MLSFLSREGVVDLYERGVEDLAGEFFQVTLEGMGVEELEDGSHEEGEGGTKREAKPARYVLRAGSEMLDLGEGNEV